MTDTDFSRLLISRAGGVVTVTIDNPPVNVLDVPLMSEICRFLIAVRDDADARVLVFQSADPEFFIAHVDMTLIDEPQAFDEFILEAPEGLNPFQAFGELLREQPQVTIVKLAGFARGGGAEFVAAADMVFAADGQAGLAQCEALMGITPGGGATQYLADRMTRGRALEAILGADLVDAATAERYGWINRALPAAELDDFVERLARNIAALPDGVIAAAKKAIPATDLRQGFVREHNAWAGLFERPAAEKLIRGGLRAGAQTKDGERALEDLMRGLAV
ncbi:enoyl-CoA hydratase/isomerase family protein [Rhizobium leguminosarum]|uniref:enoyl-CoA hydratase/isomerase family protein n=1 Tax=Rhizobium ruizarguesonis TaxID=2081791 RepID=UPI0013BC2BCB|nr:enoyl-CoA hydratase/isomerase family protein [Rhizobium ruizarguesonis]NEH33123.1 enoyl-CoA hydratase/isomerase family protein [Rhizobium ruizarguesonis]NEI23444.1 enoyl-CoA hydratase/isomerase family protein [Rhizobium ruizarguesonis]NEJ10362.1 enoyl-CoA hydratase/isomerase family protein [Rhizobium ruizarguesonis]NEK12807.1 enoyl-CoA hydratase/isomerase family protein [Rhizobium ruizarguesonis]